MKKTVLLSTLLFLLTFISCKESKKAVENSPNEIPSGKYELRSIQGKGLTSKLYISFTASEKRIQGKTDCNGYMGEYTLDNNKINFKPITATEMYCEEHVMLVERSFFEALSNATVFTIDNNMLTLLSEENGTVLLKAYKSTKEED